MSNSKSRLIVVEDDPLLSPHIAAQPRFNALNDLSDMLAGLAREIVP